MYLFNEVIGFYEESLSLLLSSGTKLQLSSVKANQSKSKLGEEGRKTPSAPKDLLFLGLLGETETRLRKIILLTANNSMFRLQYSKLLIQGGFPAFLPSLWGLPALDPRWGMPLEAGFAL